MYARNGTTGSYVGVFLAFREFSTVTSRVTNGERGTPFPTSSPARVLSCSVDVVHAEQGEIKSLVVIIYILLTAKDDEYFLNYFLAIFISSFMHSLLSPDFTLVIFFS